MTLLERAISSVKANELSFCKFISPNDAGETGGHQDGFYIPKNSISILFDEPGIKGENKDRFVLIKWFDGQETESRFIYYGKGSRNEYRITKLGRDFNVGYLFILVKESDSIYEAFILSNKNEIDSFLDSFHIDSSETNSLISKVNYTDSNPEEIEIEDDLAISEEESETEIPNFDPKDINIVVEQRSLDSLIKRIRYGNINLNTHFQRKGDLWSTSTMSRLIESILIRFPLPSFYFDATEDESWLVVDGLQRLSTIKKFVLDDKPLKLTGLEFLKEFEGFTYDMLPGTMKRRIEEAQVTTYLIKPGTPTQVKYSVFYRINTGGLVLNAQEIRHALNQGRATLFLQEITETPIFRQTVNVSGKRMQDRELVLRFVAFSMYPYSNYSPSMLSFLNRVIEELNKLNNANLDALKSTLYKSLEVSHEIFGKDMFSKSILDNTLDNTRVVVNRALFETWTVLLGKLNDNEHQNIISNKHNLILDFKLLLSDNQFYKSITESTTSKAQVLERFSRIDELIKKYKND